LVSPAARAILLSVKDPLDRIRELEGGSSGRMMLCYFANEFPRLVETFLGFGLSLRRRFREETITDLIMGNLLIAGIRRVIVEFPNEPITGADMILKQKEPPAFASGSKGGSTC
jgi:hypothetical protein